MCSGLVCVSDSGTWCDRQVSSTFLPSTSLGPVQPFGVRRMIIGHSGRPVSPSSRAARWIAAIWSNASSNAVASCW